MPPTALGHRSAKRSAKQGRRLVQVTQIGHGGGSRTIGWSIRGLSSLGSQRVAVWVYGQKVVALSKMSHHQADIEARAKAAAEGEGDTYVAPVRPIGIGDGFLRLAEKALCQQERDNFRAHLMPYQVGVAVAGGLNMWCTVVECLLQSDAVSSPGRDGCRCSIDSDGVL